MISLTNGKRVKKKKNSFLRGIWEWAACHLWLVTVIVFLFGFALRLYFSFKTGPMVTQVVYPDEIRFLHIAQSLAQHGQIMVRGAPASFQKILYPLLISPAFLLTDNVLRQANIIMAINSLLVSSTVFPALILAKKITKNSSVILISILFTATLPDMAYSALIMSEALYMPLV